MKKTILLLIALVPVVLFAQAPDRDTLARQIDDYVRTVNQAAATFLNKSLPPAERIKAIQPYSNLYDQKQVEQFKNVFLDTEETPDVRATALDKIVEYVTGDERVSRTELDLFANPRAPRVLRLEALKVEANLTFMHMNAPPVYQKLLDDPDIDIRAFAFTKLIVHGDARAQQRLIDGLLNPDAAPLAAPLSIGILSMAPKKEFYPAVYKVFLTTKDPATRLEAIRALAFFPEARKDLIAISRDANEKEDFREAALGALYAGDREHIVDYVTPLLGNESSPSRLQAMGIQMTIDIRQAMPSRLKRKTADDYDRLIQRLSRESKDDVVRQVASRYIDAVRPRY